VKVLQWLNYTYNRSHGVNRIRLLILPVLLSAWLLAAFFRVASQPAQLSAPASAILPAISAPSPPEALMKIHPSLAKRLAERDSVAQGRSAEMLPVIIEWRSLPVEMMLPQGGGKSLNRLQQRTQVVSSLQTYSQQAAAALNTALQTAVQQGLAADVRSFWVSPIISAKAAPELIVSLAARDDVRQIRLDEQIWLENATFSTTDAPSELPWNLSMLAVEQAQQLLGLDGSGVVVANLDTGVDWQHPALMKKYRGYNPRGPAQHAGNWYVVTGEPYLYPGDGIGHGTHTMGTMVGEDDAGNRSGVAPGARWIAVKLFNNQGYTYESWVHAAFQWILAPNGNPALAPDIVNNSWGSSFGGDVRYRADVAALLAAGILPVFSAGNNGPEANSIGSPASYPESLAVGAVDQDRSVASFSSRGPSPWNVIKPDVSAPGVDVRSAFPGGGYAIADGTSMAAPHVAGLAALLLQADPSLSPEQIKSILKETASPLGAVTPNNASGWGLVNAYSAALRVVPHGTLKGNVTQSGSGINVPYPQLTAIPFVLPSTPLNFSGKADGSFLVALKPGVYDLSVSAFGHFSQTVHAVSILNGGQTNLSIQLPALPSGVITGKVVDSQSGNPLAAKLSVEGTPLQATSDSSTGAYTLSLPEGDWHIRIQAESHRTVHITQTIAAGNVYPLDISLSPAPQILLIDAGRWYFESQVNYYEDALDALDMPYTLWSIRDLGSPYTPDERPRLNDLLPYDIVIWSDPMASPGWIGMDDVITGYLKSGGNLLLSGEDILYLDGGGTIYISPASYMVHNLKLAFDHEGDLSPLKGVPGTLFEDLDIYFNMPDSQPQSHPDAAHLLDDLFTQPALAWQGNGIGASTASICRPFRAYWQGFGLEGAGPRSHRIALLNHILEWFSLPADPHGLAIRQSHAQLIGKPGENLAATFQLYNTGVLSDVIRMDISGGDWTLDIEIKRKGQDPPVHLQSGAEFPLDGCQELTMTATVHIPPDALRNDHSQFTITFTSQSDASLQKQFNLTAKTHAPLLLVDNQLWYQNLLPFTQTLETLGLPYDIYNTQEQVNLRIPAMETMLAYPTIFWTTGYNWFQPLGREGVTRLQNYLDNGGRLLLTSQDLLDVYGVTPFFRERLGIQDASITVTATQVTGELGFPFWENLGPWDLSYPYPNWSDGIFPTKSATVILRDQNYHAVGVIRRDPDWRTAYFSFPLETMSSAANLNWKGRLLLWLSPFGESQLTAPPTALAGEQIPITFTLRLAQSQAMSGIKVLFPLPEGADFSSQQNPVGWTYDASLNSLLWTGTLQPGAALPLSAWLRLESDLPDGSSLPLRIFLYDAKGLVTIAYQSITINRPWLRLSSQVNPAQALINDTVHFSLTLSNAGVQTSNASLSMTMPVGLEVFTDTLQYPFGNLTFDSGGMSWQGDISPRDKLSIAFDARVRLESGGKLLLAPVFVRDLYSQRQAWFPVVVLERYFFPMYYLTYQP